MYILLALISFFFTWVKLYQDLLDRFSRFFHQMEGICVNFLNSDKFFRFLKGRCHGNQFCVVPDFFPPSQSISGSAGPIFTIYPPYGRPRYSIADDQSDLLFSHILTDIVMATNFVAKLPTPALIALAFQNGMGYRYTWMCAYGTSVRYIRISLWYFCFRWKMISLVQASVHNVSYRVTVSLQ